MKLFKNAKKLLALSLAFAILTVSLFSGGAFSVSAESQCGGTIVEKWDKVSDGVTGDWYDGTFETGDGSESNPYIISSAEELAWVCKNTTVENSAGVYYKVDPTIKAFDMNTVDGVDLTVDGLTATQVKDMVAGKILGKVWHPGYAGCFAGSFDGNGVTIYGLYAGPAYYNQNSFDTNSPYGCNYAALFSKIDATTASFKNFSIKNSYFTGEVSAAVYAESVVNSGSATIENVMVSNCYIESTSGDKYGGVLVGFCRYDQPTGIASKVKINNCLVYDNVVSNKATSAVRLVGIMEAYCADDSGNKVRDYENYSITNTVAIGCDIENTGSWWQKDSKFFENCYTTGTPDAANTTIIKLADANAAKGSAAVENLSGLNAADWFFNTTTYPQPAVFHDITTVDNGNGTHTASCGCGLSSVAIAHVYEDGVCACGVAAKCGEIVSVYSGTPDTKLAGEGTAEKPYLVTSADEFAAVALGYITSTENTYFKVKDVDAFYMNGGETVAAMTDVNDVKSYFAANGTTANSWNASGAFIGQFDGNGVTVYGVYANHTGQYDYAGLFPKVDGHSSIKNIAIKNSYFSSYSKDGAIGSLVGGTIWKGDNNTNTSVAIENVVSANNYLASTNSGVQQGASVLMGRFFEKHYPTINNCIMYGNLVENAYTGVDVKSGMITECAASYENFKVNNVIAIGVTPWTIVDKGDGTYGASGWYLSVLNTGHFKNIYTDQSTDKLQAFQPTNNSAEILEKYNINSIATADMMGAAAVENLPTLDSNWIFSADAYPDLRVFHDAELTVTEAEDGAGHEVTCSCGAGAGVVVSHNFVCDVEEPEWDSYYCEGCGYVCEHGDVEEGMVEYEGDCVTGSGYTFDCSICGYHEETFDEATGHSFVNHEEEIGPDCQTPGTIAYKECSVCKKNYATDAADLEPFENALTDIVGNKGDCVPMVDAETGHNHYEKDENNHWLVCSKCNETIITEAHDGEIVDNGDGTHSVKCAVCAYTSENTPHSFVCDVEEPEWDSYYCEVCGYVCEHVDLEEGLVEYEGDCVTGSGYTFDCSICGYHEESFDEATGHSFVNHEEEPALDCQTPGTIAHKECSVCEKNYATDASDLEPFENALTDKDLALPALDHTYTNACDTDCNECGDIREVGEHVYDNAGDADCNECGAVRAISWEIEVDVTGAHTIVPNDGYAAEFSAADIIVTDKSGSAVKYNDKVGGFPLVKGETYVVEFTEAAAENVVGEIEWAVEKIEGTIFADVPAGEWYNDAVTYSVGAGIITGYGGTNNFGAADKISRHDFVVILARFAGVDLSVYDDAEIPFKDVADNQYYTNAILWAAESGITSGYTSGVNAGKFGVGDEVTREQLVTFLYRYASNINGSAPKVSDDAAEKAATYPDFAAVGSYATEAVIWALDKGVISGQGGTHIAPAGNALRAEVAKIFYNIFLNGIF